MCIGKRETFFGGNNEILVGIFNNNCRRCTNGTIRVAFEKRQKDWNDSISGSIFGIAGV